MEERNIYILDIVLHHISFSCHVYTDMNRYQYSVSSFFPKCLTTILYLWTAYVTITRNKIFSYKAVLFAISFLLVLSLYTYFQVIIIGPGSPLDFYDLAIRDLKDVEIGTELPPEFLTKRSLTIKHDGRFRVCQTCKFWKPDRCHHCSSCNQCILKMDHHCPWFAVCIGFLNQKFFIQFLVYTTIYSFMVLFLTSCQLYSWFHSGTFENEFIDFKLLQVWLLAIAVTISMICFSGFSIFQLIKNQTTIEMYGIRRYRKEFEIVNGFPPNSDNNAFDLGSYCENWKEVMGESISEWLLPIRTFKYMRNRNSLDESGLYFNLNKSPTTQGLLNDANLQDRLIRMVTPRSSMDSQSHLV